MQYLILIVSYARDKTLEDIMIGAIKCKAPKWYYEFALIKVWQKINHENANTLI